MKSLFYLVGLLYLLVTTPVSIRAQVVPDSLLQLPTDSARALAIGHLASNYAFKEKNFTAADKAFRVAMYYQKKIKSLYVNTHLHKQKGVIEQNRQNYSPATEAYQQAFEGFKQLGDKEMQVDILTRIEQLFFSQNELELAKKYALQALKILQENPSLPPYLLGDCYNELANISGESGDSGKALEYTDKAIEAYKKAGEDQSVHSSLLNSAISLRKLGRLNESVARFKQVEKYGIEAKKDLYRIYVYVNLPKALADQKNYTEALAINQKAVQLMQSNSKLKDIRLQQEIYTNFHEIYAATDDYKQAYENLRLAQQYQDSITNLDKKREMTRLETQFETKQKEQKIVALGSMNKAQQEQLLILVCSLIGVCGVLALLYWQYNRLKRSKVKISEQAEQMKLLMKELHHRVKNNLAIVSSLLKLQSSRIEEESAAKAVREGQQRVEAMSLIHQRLYQTDQLTTINMRDYIVDLTESLMMAYGYKPDTFDLRLSIEKQELDVDLAIPVGLILNELITNSFKHAYEKVETPMLSISLTMKKGLTLELKDNGPGINEELWKKKGGSFGKRLIRNLSEQTGGQFQITNDNGTYYSLYITEQTLKKVA
jgi:two-component sensor histidine kinase